MIPRHVQRRADLLHAAVAASPSDEEAREEIRRILDGFIGDVVEVTLDDRVPVEKALRFLFGALAFAEDMEGEGGEGFEDRLGEALLARIQTMQLTDQVLAASRAEHLMTYGDKWSWPK